jgi:predicted component of type VI protein secretion system
MADNEELAVELHQTANELHVAAETVEMAERRADVAEHVAADAVAQIDHALERAAEIERAAIETVLGARLNALEERFTAWQGSLETQIAAEITTQLTPLAALVTEALREVTEELPSIQQPSEPEPEPETSMEPKEQERKPENPEPQKRRKAHHWI